MAQEQASAPAQTAPASAPAETKATETQEPVESQEETQEIEASDEETTKESSKEQKKLEKKLKKLKLKVDGEEIEEEFDPENDDYIRQQLQLAKAAQKRMSETAQLKKELTDFIEQLRNNPLDALSQEFIGVDIKKMVNDYVEKELENAKKSPEQLEREKLQAELQALKEEREREKEELNNREKERLLQAETERYDMLMEKALSTSDLPKTPYTVKRMADYMLLGLQNGIELTPEEVVPLVRDEMQKDLNEMFAVMPEEVIEQVIGKDVFNRVRKKNLQKAKQAPQAAAKSVKEVSKPSEDKKPKEKQDFKKFFGF